MCVCGTVMQAQKRPSFAPPKKGVLFCPLPSLNRAPGKRINKFGSREREESSFPKSPVFTSLDPALPRKGEDDPNSVREKRSVFVFVSCYNTVRGRTRNGQSSVLGRGDGRMER